MERERGFDFERWGDPSRFDHDAWWEGPLELLVVALVVAFLVVATVWVLRRLSSRDDSTASGDVVPAVGATAADPAVDLLRLRYARGEVDHEVFRRTFDDLTAPAPGRPMVAPGDETTPTGA